MQSVGQKLREAREAQGRTLEQVHSSTRIPFKTLQAIESDDLNAISSAFLYRSFARQFAADVQFDYTELESGVQETAEKMPAPLMPGQGVHGAPKVAALQIGKPRKSHWVHALSLFAVAVVVCSGFYAAWQNRKPSLPVFWSKFSAHRWSSRPPTAVAGKGPNEARLTAPTIRSEPLSLASSLPGISDVNKEALEQSGGFTLELSATEPAWLSIIADGKVSFKGILERAETKILAGHRTARIRTGNAGGVEVVFNGKPLGTLGSRGQVRTVLFTNDNYQVLDTTDRGLFINFSRKGELALLQPFPELLPGL